MTSLPKYMAALSLVIGASGCLTFTDDDGPTLSIELFWDELPLEDDFAGGSCSTARVDRMEWTLYDDRGEDIDGYDEPCHNQINISNLPPGSYEIDINGFDRDDELLWAVTCTGLDVLRFDGLYECDVLGISDSEEAADDEENEEEQ